MTWWQILICLVFVCGVIDDIVSTICNTIKDVKQAEKKSTYKDFYDDEESEVTSDEK